MRRPRIFSWETPTVALVSNCLPPGGSGYQHILDQLLGAIPPARIATVGIGNAWGDRAHPPFPGRRSSPGHLESLLTTVAVAGAEKVAASVFGRLLPNVRRIFATMDPTLGFATSWARGVGAELWVYAIDLHIASYWRSGAFMRSRLTAWRDEAFRRATRIFALSEVMAEWLRSIGVDRKIEILPPLFLVGRAAPLPPGPLTFLMSGTVYSINAAPLRWLERAVGDLDPTVRLRLVTPSLADELRAVGLDLTRWSVTTVAPSEVSAEVARATWGFIGMDSGRSEDAERVAWPTKLREYLSVGRPVLCVSRPEYAVAKMVGGSSWGVLAEGEAGTRAAVARILAEPRVEAERRGLAAHRFALEQIDDARIGAALRRDLLT